MVRRLRGQISCSRGASDAASRKGELIWGALDHSRALQMLHNPRYAGAFAYGRTRTAYNAKLKPCSFACRRPTGKC